MQQEHHVTVFDQNLMINQISPLKELEAHSNSIESLAVHPKQQIFATGSHDKSIKVWDVEKFKEKMTLSDHKEGVWTLDYSPDGHLLASGGPDKSVLIWDSKKSSPGTKIGGHKDKVYAVKFNEHGKLLGTCGEQGELFIWDVAKTDKPLSKIEKPNLVLYDLRWSGNDQFFFVTGLGSEIFAFDAITFKEVSSDHATLNAPDSKCESIGVNFKHYSNRVFCGTSRGPIVWYQMHGNQLKKEAEFAAHLDSVRTINFHNDRKLMLTTGRDGSAKVWDASADNFQPKILGNLVAHNENIPGAAFVGKDMALTGSWDQKLALWSLKDLIQ